MNSLSKIPTLVALLFSFSFCTTQIKNRKTENVKIYGNCAICETSIEKAGNVKRIAIVDWNKDTKIAMLMYDTIKTKQSEILKRIALAGYDSDSFLAPDNAYSNLQACCKYERVNKTMAKKEAPKMKVDGSDRPETKKPMETQEINPLSAVFENYFGIKEALVQSNNEAASEKSKALLTAINAVKMDKLLMDVHMAWMKIVPNLKSNSDKIASATNIEKQRNAFTDLSANMYDLVKVSKQETPIYYQHCPMYNNGKGADWLSKENGIKNPYYGSQMLTCGSTVETIK